MTILEFKQKLQFIVGAEKIDNMFLQHRDEDGKILATLQPDDKTLNDFNLVKYSNIHVVVDINADEEKGGIVSQLNALQNGQLANVPKYEISEEAYKKRDNTFAKWKDANLKDFYAKKEQEEKEQIAKWDETLKEKDIKINDRCEIGSNQNKHRGKVVFIGEAKIDKTKGVWIGIELDEPFGDNNGTIQGKQYFKCNDKYGKFVRTDEIQVGDYPVIDELELSDDDDQEL
eukprot:CAMPEP_0201564502 /NCGR_PEP_ID=MMETSP0190_2-20130828/2834_1 /ASSEMBLY_ACC=CAM_ASM_000263 /TAXON_ID=37353 /ORGANISM="Rosalina sp." /LENGTH=229 /DNA_ID=CAMNT_0047980753 /DNA_START=182 /DNA_END=871 /DNA_ORIENTATION=-